MPGLGKGTHVKRIGAVLLEEESYIIDELVEQHDGIITHLVLVHLFDQALERLVVADDMPRIQRRRFGTAAGHLDGTRIAQAHGRHPKGDQLLVYVVEATRCAAHTLPVLRGVIALYANEP